ncbi:hypothetical protein TRFO_09549 [Tritrichomonas foetus]|uniref:Tubby C-terminal domain-containing protein n=1 Tax=Tritrichomonas foetus TaxID=1144522 RepID=A0A1J4JDU3_9EUKA|nr:hypothetical protein TRFO_09549 [Tritrichomonas foetus]|eukprot:OHS97272.1 hypothetical protein TRFO_09549 [Tritrichomonas foetus]
MESQQFVDDFIQEFKPTFVLTDYPMNDSTITELNLDLILLPKRTKLFDNKLTKIAHNKERNLINNVIEKQTVEIKHNENSILISNCPQIEKMELIKRNCTQSKEILDTSNFEFSDFSDDLFLLDESQKEIQKNEPNNSDDNYLAKSDNLTKSINPVAISDEHEPSNSNTTIEKNSLEENISQENKTNSKIFDPVPKGSIVSFILIDNKESFDIFEDETNVQLCKIIKKGKKIGASNFEIYDNDFNKIGYISSNFSHSTFVSKIIDSDNLEKEVAAVLISSQRSGLLQARQFEAYIPVNQSAIESNNSFSTLLPNPNLRITMKPKQAVLKDGVPVIYFGPRVKKMSIKNFVLMNSLNQRQMVFGKESSKHYICEVCAPLTLIQAISIAISQFK